MPPLLSISSFKYKAVVSPILSDWEIVFPEEASSRIGQTMSSALDTSGISRPRYFLTQTKDGNLLYLTAAGRVAKISPEGDILWSYRTLEYSKHIATTDSTGNTYLLYETLLTYNSDYISVVKIGPTGALLWACQVCFAEAIDKSYDPAATTPVMIEVDESTGLGWLVFNTIYDYGMTDGYRSLNFSLSTGTLSSTIQTSVPEYLISSKYDPTPNIINSARSGSCTYTVNGMTYYEESTYLSAVDTIFTVQHKQDSTTTYPGKVYRLKNASQVYSDLKAVPDTLSGSPWDVLNKTSVYMLRWVREIPGVVYLNMHINKPDSYYTYEPSSWFDSFSGYDKINTAQIGSSFNTLGEVKLANPWFDSYIRGESLIQAKISQSALAEGYGKPNSWFDTFSAWNTISSATTNNPTLQAQ